MPVHTPSARDDETHAPVTVSANGAFLAGRAQQGRVRYRTGAVISIAAIALVACGGGDEGDAPAAAGDELAAVTVVSSVTTSSVTKQPPPHATAPEASSASAATADACTRSRAFGLVAIRHEAASAGAVGTGVPRERSQSSELWTLEVSALQAEYLAESLAGGCIPTLEFTTEGTTSALGSGLSSYEAKVRVLLDNIVLRRRIHEAASFPMVGCDSIVCQRFTDYAVELERTLVAGNVIVVESTAVADAIAGGTSSSDQAHADWQLDSPLLRVPIP